MNERVPSNVIKVNFAAARRQRERPLTWANEDDLEQLAELLSSASQSIRAGAESKRGCKLTYEECAALWDILR